MRDSIICTALFTLLAVGGYAAELDKEVEVTRAYVPEIKQATKLHLTPDMTDDNYIKPDVDYAITPLSIETSLDSELYEPVMFDMDEYAAQKRYYTKLGVGLPFQTVADLYATPISGRSGYIGGYFNQDGRFADIENDYGDKLDAAQNHMRGGVVAGRIFSNHTLEGSVNYNNDRWSRYATENSPTEKALYQSVDFSGRFGDQFVDMKRLNFSIETAAEYFWSNTEYSSTTFGVAAAVGRDMWGGETFIKFDYNNISGSDLYRDHTVGIMAHYAYDSRLFDIKLGLKYYNDRVSYDSTSATNVASSVKGASSKNRGNYIIPDASLSYAIAKDRAIAYAQVDGVLLYSDFATLSESSPYIASGLFASENSVAYDADFGVKGRVMKGRFGYDIFAQYGIVDNNLYWLLVGNEFLASYSTLNSFSFNVEAEYLPMSNLQFGVDLKVAAYTDSKRQTLESGKSNVELRFDAQYMVKSWRFKLDGEMLSSRKCSAMSLLSLSTIEMPTTFDLGLSVEYLRSDSFVVFVECNNLLNDDLYRWVGYREYGINAMAGVKFQF